jgi:3-isopropylmalate/(R)-2-methylmalate dehydratase small subunit
MPRVAEFKMGGSKVSRILKGKAWCFKGLMDVDWEICPVEHMRGFHEDSNVTYDRRLAELGAHCMATVDPEFPNKVRPGDFIVASEGFGYGHDHDHACMSIRGAGVAAVICEATNINFKRNAIHHGLAVIEVKDVLKHVSTGDALEVQLANGVIRNLTTGAQLAFIPYPDFILGIIDAGNLYTQLASQVKAGQYH